MKDHLIIDGLDLDSQALQVRVQDWQGHVMTYHDAPVAPCWTIREGDSITFPADPAVCPDCSEPLVLWRKVSRSIPDDSGVVDVHLHKPELHCTNDGCATTKVVIPGGTNLDDRAEDSPSSGGTAPATHRGRR